MHDKPAATMLRFDLAIDFEEAIFGTEKGNQNPPSRGL